MKRFLLVLVVLVAVAVGVSFYMGWVGLTSDGEGGMYHITFNVNKDKIREDEQRALDTVHGTGHGAKGDK
jgi:hypothetical protein